MVLKRSSLPSGLRLFSPHIIDREPIAPGHLQEFLPAKQPQRYAEFQSLILQALKDQAEHTRVKDQLWYAKKHDPGDEYPRMVAEVSERLFDPNRREHLIYFGPASVNDDEITVPLTIVSIFGTLPVPVQVPRNLVVPKSAKPGMVKILIRTFLDRLQRQFRGE